MIAVPAALPGCQPRSRPCQVATPSLLQAQENVAAVVVYSAPVALAWRETVPGTVPFARLLCDVMLTTPQEPIRKCIKIRTASFTVQSRVWVWFCPCAAESRA